jgi:hypothetical protein
MSPQFRRVLSAAKLTGSRIRNAAHEPLGTLEEIMIDVPSGRVAFAIFAFGGVLGIGSKLFAVPWEGLTYDEPSREFILDVDRSLFETAPGIDPSHWPDMSDPAWEADLYRFYGQQV